MSWMDSWSRPNKQSAVPPPLYLTIGDHVPYCKTCGRMMNSKKATQKDNATKYCSDRCRRHKPGPTDRAIESRIAQLLNGEEDSGIEQTGASTRQVKGDKRLIITMDEIETLFFNRQPDPTKTFGRRKNRASRALGRKDEEWKSVDMESSDEEEEGGVMLNDAQSEAQGVRTGPLIRPAQIESEINGSIGGEKGWAERKAETEEEVGKRSEGARKAEEREMVRRAARRGVVFGFEVGEQDTTREKNTGTKMKKKRVSQGSEEGVQEDQRRKCEAIMRGQVVEPSYAKGNWSIRWRE